jgi:tRNA(Ile)-lysidine synthase
MLEQVRDAIIRQAMLAAGDRVVIAVSGGPDSVALLHTLHRLAPEFAVTLHVFHMNHGLRGESSAKDAEYVAALAIRLGLPCTIVTLREGELREQPGSLEANARAARYQAIERLAGELGANRAALGHNRNDQAETVLMRLLRGAGARGLSGIPPVRVAGGLTFVRPLLAIPRQEIERYCERHELFPRLDESNRKPEYLRNQIRLDLLPHLARTYNPAIAANLAQTAEVIHEEDRYLDDLALAALERCRVPGEGVSLVADALLREPLPLARRVVRLAARLAAGPVYDLGLDAVTRVLALAAEQQGSRQLDLPGGLQLMVEYGLCRFATHGGMAAPDPAGEWPVLTAGATVIPELELTLEAGDAGVPDGRFEAVFDAERLPGPLSVRLWRPGDRLWPVGMEGSKKLQDLLVDAKVPKKLRNRVLLLTAGDQILWIIGYRLDRRFLAGPTTSLRLFFRAKMHVP